MDNIPSGFCVVPWIHAHINAQGFRKLCCIDHQSHTVGLEKQGQSLEDFWNSSELRHVRLQMIAGELPDRCSECGASNRRAVTKREEMNTRWGHLIDHAISATNTNGFTDLLPITFDYRSSVCNLKCRTCGPHYSTTSEIEARRFHVISKIEPETERWDAAYRERRDAALSNALKDLLEAVEQRRVAHIYWAGGEPFFDEAHWAVVQALIDNGHASAVSLAYSSNFSLISHKGRAIADLWPHFRSVSVQASADGLGAVGEYIRSGFRTATFMANVESVCALAAKCPKISLGIDVTITSIGLLHLGDLLNYALENKLTVSGKLMSPRIVNRYMAVEFLPQAVKDDWCRRWMAWIDEHDRDGRMAKVRASLNVGLTKTSFRSTGEPPLVADLRSIAAFEAVRKEKGRFEAFCAVDDRLRIYLADLPSLVF